MGMVFREAVGGRGIRWAGDPLLRLLRASLIVSILGALLFAVLAAGTSTHAQRNRTATLVVKVVGQDGGPIGVNADVTLSGTADAVGQHSITGSNGTTEFSQLGSGNYTASATAPGFKGGSTFVEVTSSTGVYEATISMEPVSGVATSSSGTEGMVLAPKAQQEVDAGVAAMKAGHYDEAQQHLEAAYKLAPGNPDVSDLLGQVYIRQNDLDKALECFTRALSIDPNHMSALLDLGQLRMRQGDNVMAATTLERAVERDPQSWMAHWMLGVAYLRSQENEKAREQAMEAVKTGKGAAAGAEYLLGESLAALGKNSEAIEALQQFMRDAPKNSFVPAAQALIAKLQGGTPAASDPPPTLVPSSKR